MIESVVPIDADPEEGAQPADNGDAAVEEDDGACATVAIARNVPVGDA